MYKVQLMYFQMDNVGKKVFFGGRWWGSGFVVVFVQRVVRRKM